MPRNRRSGNRKKAQGATDSLPSPVQKSDVAGSSTDAERVRTSSEGSGDSGGSHHTDGSGRSSQQEVDSSKAQQILVSTRVSPADLSISFQINADQRPETRLQGQGDHITSYTVIIQALLASADANLRGGIVSIKKLAEATLEQEELDQFNQIVEPRTHTHDDRKAVIASLKNNPAFKEVYVVIDNELKYAKMALLSNYLAELTTRLLEGLQQHELATVFSRGRTGKAKDEGINARTAARALVALNQIYRCAGLELKDFDAEMVKRILHSLSPKKLSDRYDTEEQHVLRYGINALSAEPGKTTDGGARADKFFKELSNSKTTPRKMIQLFEELGNELKRDINKINSFVGDLYDYRRVLTFDLKEAFPLPTDIGKQNTSASEKFWKAKIEDIFPPEDYNYYITGEQVTIIRKDIESLSGTIVRHMVIIKAAFPELIKQIGLQQIRDIFIQKTVLNEQGWKDHKLKEGFVTLDYLKKKLTSSETNEIAPVPATNSGPSFS